MECDKSPSGAPKDPQKDLRDKAEAAKDKPKDPKGHASKRSKEDEILHKLSKLSTKVAASDEWIQKLSALPEILAKQAEQIECLTAAKQDYFDFEPYEEYHEDFPYDSYEECEAPDSVQPLSTKDSFMSLLKSQSPEQESTNKECLEVQSDQTQSDENCTLNILLKHAPPETYGTALDVGVANVFRELMERPMDKKILEQLKEDHKAPDNCRILGAPRVNKEIWANLDKTAMSCDWDLRGQQEIVGIILTSLAKTVQFVNVTHKKDENSGNLMNLLTEAISAAFYLSKDMTLKRRAAIKRHLPRDVAALCNSDMKTTELFFGDNFAELLKASRAAMSLTRPYRGRGSYRMHPYPPGRGRGKPGTSTHFSASSEPTLNSSRPPHFYRGGRGGRGRPFNQSGFHKNYQNSTHQNNNQA